MIQWTPYCHTSMLHVVVIVSALTGCHSVVANSTTADQAPLLPPAVMRRRSADLLDNLRRQLMRNNYDYQDPSIGDEPNKHRPQDKQISGDSNHSFVRRAEKEHRFRSKEFNAESHERRHARDSNNAQESKHKHDRQDARYPNHGQDMRNAYDPTYANDRQDAQDRNYGNIMPDALGSNFAHDRRDPYDLNNAHIRPYDQKRHDKFNDAEQQMKFVPVTSGAHEEHGYAQSFQDPGDAFNTAEELDVDGGQEVQDTQNPTGTRDRGHTRAADAENKDHMESKDVDQETEKAPKTRNMPKSLEIQVNRLKHSKLTHDVAQKNAPNDHAISKNDLLYYINDDRLRRKNYVSADLSCSYADADDVERHADNDIKRRATNTDILADDTKPTNDASAISLANSDGAENVAPATNIIHKVPVNTANFHGSVVNGAHVSVSNTQTDGNSDSSSTPDLTTPTNNVTYKLRTMRSRGARRYIEERVAGGVALISLDKSPFPQLRLPSARRQYMHERQDMRPALAGATEHRHHRHVV